MDEFGQYKKNRKLSLILSGVIMQELFSKKQRGITLIGLIFVMAILGMIGVLGLKVMPTVLEFQAIKRLIVTASKSGSTVNDVKAAFDKGADVGYIESITSKDLVIVKNNSEFDVSFAYNKKIPLVGPASLLLEYEGSTPKANTSKAIP